MKGQPADGKRTTERYHALWTPTILLLDPEGVEQHRIEGFLPVDDFLAQIELGLGHAAFKHERWVEAERWFDNVAQHHGDSDAAAEATYWVGVARYKATGDARHLSDTAVAFAHRFQNTPWAKKASVWGKRAA